MVCIVIDDEHIVLKDTISTIRKAAPNIDIHGFNNIHKLIEFAKFHKIDVAFIDIKFPSLNGLEIAEILMNYHPKINIIFITGYSHYAIDAFQLYASAYLMKPITPEMIIDAFRHLRYPVNHIHFPCVKIQTFGNFEVFVENKPIRFRRNKSKEIFAYLVHKKGTSCTLKELTGILYEDREYTTSLQSQMQTYISSLMRTLSEYSIQDIIYKGYNSFAINTTAVDCDYYRFLNGDNTAIEQYTGEYMANYSWGEFVAGYLDERILTK